MKLYHATPTPNVDCILEHGILRMRRQYVYLADTPLEAYEHAKRKAEPCDVAIAVLEIVCSEPNKPQTKKADVWWQTRFVPPEDITVFTLDFESKEVGKETKTIRNYCASCGCDWNDGMRVFDNKPHCNTCYREAYHEQLEQEVATKRAYERRGIETPKHVEAESLLPISLANPGDGIKEPQCKHGEPINGRCESCTDFELFCDENKHYCRKHAYYYPAENQCTKCLWEAAPERCPHGTYITMECVECAADIPALKQKESKPNIPTCIHGTSAYAPKCDECNKMLDSVVDSFQDGETALETPNKILEDSIKLLHLIKRQWTGDNKISIEELRTETHGVIRRFNLWRVVG